MALGSESLPSQEVLFSLLSPPLLLSILRTLEDLSRDPRPRLVPFSCGTSPGRRLALLPGSFNPPTEAHLALERAAREAGWPEVWWVLATRIVEKEEQAGLSHVDRAVLAHLLSGRPGGLALTNRGLYFEQAFAARDRLPEAEIAFVVGADKVFQIFDPRYYRERDAALSALFSRAVLLVAPRGGWGREEIEAFMARPENREFRPRVIHIELPTSLRWLSSSRARSQLEGGGRADLPETVLAATGALGAFASPERYEARQIAIERVAEAVRGGELSPWDPRLRSFLALASHPGQEGERLRRALRNRPDQTFSKPGSEGPSRSRVQKRGGLPSHLESLDGNLHHPGTPST